jgi:hypothetical protein
MEMIEGETYKIEFVKGAKTLMYINGEHGACGELEFKKGETTQAELIEVNEDEDEKTCMLVWPPEDDETVTYFNVPLDSIKLLQKRVITWEDVK